MPNTFESFIIILAIIAPGYLLRETISLFRPREDKTETEIILDSIILGFFNFVIFFMILMVLSAILPWKLLVIPAEISSNKSLLKKIEVIIHLKSLKIPILLFSYFFLFPAFFGWLFGKWNGSFSIWKSRINPYPSTWDEFFTRTPRVILYILMKNGEKKCGVFGKNSRASTNPQDKDLYLEKEIALDNNGNISAIIEGDGLWISKDQITYFSVLPYPE